MTMTELASRTALGGVKGDTFQGRVIEKVHADGSYGWIIPVEAAILQAVADKASRPDVTTLAEGTSVPVQTNGLVYVVEGGVYTVPKLEITRADEAARDLLTEQEPNQRVYVSDVDRLDRWDDTAGDWVEGKLTVTVALYDDIPAPNEIAAGTEDIVTADPIDNLNGTHVAMGAPPGEPATYLDNIG